MGKIFSAAVLTITAGALSACGPKSSAHTIPGEFNDTAHFSKVRKAKPGKKDSEQADVKGLFANLDALGIDGLTTNYASADFDSKLGATVVTDIKITGANTDGLGLSIDKLTVWGLDSQALSDRIAGKRFDETLPILSRAQAENIKLTGLETMMAGYMELSNNMSLKMIEGAVGEAMSEAERAEMRAAINQQSIDTYDIGYETLVITDLSLTPYNIDLKPLPAVFTDDGNISDEDRASGTEFWHYMQKMGAVSAAIKFADVAAYDGRIVMEMTAEGEKMTMDMGNDMLGYKDYDRGDMGYAVMRGMDYTMNLPVPIEEGARAGETFDMNMTGEFGYFTMTDYRLAKAMDHLARGVLPDRNDDNFMSVGEMIYGDMTVKVSDNELFSLDKMRFNLSDFHWLLPQKAEIEIDNYAYNFEGIWNWVKSVPEVDMELDAEGLKLIEEGLSILKKYDLAAPKFDFVLSGNWDSKTGKTDFGYEVAIEDVIRYDVTYDGGMPNFDQVMKAVPEDFSSVDEDILEAAFEDNFSFTRAKMQIKDEGMEKLFGLAVDMAQILPDDGSNPAMKMFKNSTPEILRNTAASSIMFAAGPVSAEFPPAVEYLQSLSDFVGKGGTFTAQMRPKTPMSKQSLEALEEELGDDPDPEKIVEILGLTVVHTPAK